MAACALMFRQAVVVLVVALISYTSSNRLSGHPFFKSRTVQVSTSTTPKSTDTVVIDDKQPQPSIKFPSPGQSFLDYLMNRDTYFKKAGSLRSSTESTIIISSPTTQLTSTRAADPTSTTPESVTKTSTSTTESTSQTFATSTTPESTSQTFATSATPESTSQTFATSTTPESTSQTFATSTTPESTSQTFATSTTPESTSQTFVTSTTPESTSETLTTRKSSTESTRTTSRTSTASWNNQVRPEQLPFDPQPQTRDRLNRYQLADLWLKRFRRPSVLEPVQGRFRSGDADPGNTTNGNMVTASRRPSPSNQNHGFVEVDPNGGVYIVYNRQTELRATTVATDDKLGPTPQEPTKHLDVQDKPYYGSNLGMYFENNVSASSQNQTDLDGHSARSRRAAGVGDVNASSCADAHQFQPCQYYPQCFHDLSEMCSTRDSFLGDLFSRFCSKTLETSKSAGSDLLSRYLRDVELCFREGLAKIVESPSCTEMSSTVLEALLMKRPTSCLYQRETFCDVLDDDVARPSLARMFNSTTDVQFTFRVMVNIGNMASYCRNHGASIFVTDITLLATSKDSPYKDLVGKTPMPGVVQKI